MLSDRERERSLTVSQVLREVEGRQVWVPEISATKDVPMREKRRKLYEQDRVMHVKDRPWGGHHGAIEIKGINNPTGDYAHSFQVFMMRIPPGCKSQKHGHPNPAMFYILKGSGYEIHDGKRYDWKAGDVVIVQPGTVHQHFNPSKDEEALAIIMHAAPVYILMHLWHQHTVEQGSGGVSPELD